MDNCRNCAWYCHSDGKCYAADIAPLGNIRGAVKVYEPELFSCRDWQFDGLEDWERTWEEANER